MDVLRRSPARRWKGVVAFVTLAGGIAVAGATVEFAARSQLAGHPSILEVEIASVVTDRARRGPYVLTVPAAGTVVPRRPYVLSASEAGVVHHIFVTPGDRVEAGSLVLTLGNPAIELDAGNARDGLLVARANEESALEEARAIVVSKRTALSDAQAQHSIDALQFRSIGELHVKGYVSDLDFYKAKIAATRSANAVRDAAVQVELSHAAARAKAAAVRAQTDLAAAQLSGFEARSSTLAVRSSNAGIVLSVDVERGSAVAAGTALARIAESRDLLARLQVAQSDVHLVRFGTPTEVDTGTAVHRGRVVRVEPAAQNGTVGVDVALDDTSAADVRPASTVQGTLIVKSLTSAISIATPAGAAENSWTYLFKIAGTQGLAVRTRVLLGGSAGSRTQILAGIDAGDVVIVSDTSQYVNEPRIRIQ